MKKKIKFIDLFAGIGGFHKALEIAARKLDYDIECVFVSEIDKEAIKTYSSNFDYKNKIMDIKDLDSQSSQVPNHNFLLAGFPCQAFSNAGKKEGFLDKLRGTFFFDIAKILKNKKPKYILLENVKHLVNHNNGKTWETIIETLDKKLGYHIPSDPLILSPEEFGIPQSRKRVFIPGILKSATKKEVDFSDLKNQILNSIQKKQMNRNTIRNKFLEKKVNSKYYLKNQENKYLIQIFKAWNEFLKNVKVMNNRTLPVIWTWELKENYKLDSFSFWKKKYISDMRQIYLLNKKFIDKWMIKWNVLSWKKRDQKFEWQAGKEINDIKESFIQLRQSGIRCKRPTMFPTLVAMVQIPIIFDKLGGWRNLTPREVANLQSFPKAYKLHSQIVKKSNDYLTYKQFGNAVNVDVVSSIQKFLLEKF